MPGYKIDRFTDLAEGLKKYLTCSVCHQICKNAIKSKCDHTFCKECVQQIIDDNHRKCPECEHKFSNKRSNKSRNAQKLVVISKYIFRSHKIINNMINDLNIKCDFEFNGCKQSIKLSSLQTHLNECQYKKCFCSCDRPNEAHDCAANLMRRIYDDHEIISDLSRKNDMKDKKILEWEEKFKTFSTLFLKELTNEIEKNQIKDKSIEDLQQKYDKIVSKYSEKTSNKTEINQKMKDIFQTFTKFWGRELFISKLFIGNTECGYSRSTPNPDNIKFTIDCQQITIKNFKYNSVAKTQDICLKLNNIKEFYYCFGKNIRAIILRPDIGWCQWINTILNLGKSPPNIYKFDVNTNGMQISE